MDAPPAGPSRPSSSRSIRPLRKLRPPAPAAPVREGKSTATKTLPTKVLQGARTRRTDTARAGFGRDTLFVTRKTGLGALIARARSLVVDEGHTHLTIYALGAAIPHALLLLHALMDVLPFPAGPGGMWYELATGTVECVDELEGAGDDADNDIGAIEDDGGVQTRHKASLRADIHVAPRSNSVYPDAAHVGGIAKRDTANGRGKDQRARPSAKRRRAMRRAAAAADEEDMMNG